MVAVLLVIALCFAPGLVPAQQFEVRDSLAPDVPSPQAVIDKMLQAAHLQPGETLYDLGSGEGRILITAAKKFKAKAVGVELNKRLCKIASEKVKAAGVADLVTIIHGNLLDIDLSPADVVTLYLLTSSNRRVKPNLEKYLKPGARVVSNDFPIPGWTPTRTASVRTDRHLQTIYVYEIARK